MNIIKQIYYGLKDLYKIQMIHADLKPDNILIILDEDTIHIQLTDFDDSLFFDEINNDIVMRGSLRYVDPITFMRTPFHSGTNKTAYISYMTNDLYSLGIILYILFMNRFPTFTKPHTHGMIGDYMNEYTNVLEQINKRDIEQANERDIEQANETLDTISKELLGYYKPNIINMPADLQELFARFVSFELPHRWSIEALDEIFGYPN